MRNSRVSVRERNDWKIVLACGRPQLLFRSLAIRLCREPSFQEMESCADITLTHVTFADPFPQRCQSVRHQLRPGDHLRVLRLPILDLRHSGRDVPIPHLGLGHIEQTQRGIGERGELFFMQVVDVEICSDSANAIDYRGGRFIFSRWDLFLVWDLKDVQRSSAGFPTSLFRTSRHLHLLLGRRNVSDTIPPGDDRARQHTSPTRD